jgi:hypothetical protein
VPRFIARLRRSCDAEKFKLISDGGNSGSKNVNEAMMETGGVWPSLLLAGVWSQAIQEYNFSLREYILYLVQNCLLG